MEFGKRIKKRREELGMSQESLAQKLGYKSRSSINKIELGLNDISQSKIVAFAKALHTTPEYLMGWSEEELLDRALMIDDDLLEKYGNVFEAEEEQSERNNKLIMERLHSALEKVPPSYRKQILELTDINEIAKRLNVTVPWLMGEDSQEVTTLSFGTSYNPIIDKIISNCQQLNETGQKKVLDFSDDLISSNNYAAIGRYSIAAHGADETEENFQLPDEEIST